MDNVKTEINGVSFVKLYVNRCSKLVPYITENDRTPIWDGEIYVYNDDETHNVKNFFARVPVQVKGTINTEDNYYRIGREYLDGFKTERGCIFFLAKVKENSFKILYAILSSEKLKKLLQKDSETIKIVLEEVPADPNAFEQEVIAFAKDRNGEKTEISSPNEIKDLVDGFTEIEKYLGSIDDKDTRFELESLIKSIKDLKDDGTIGWRDRFIYYSRKAFDLAINNVKNYDCLNLQFALGAYFHKQKLYHLVEGYYTKSLEEVRKRAIVNPSIYDWHVATALNNMANLHVNLSRYPEAEEEYEEALDIYRKLAAINPDTYNGDVARSLNNLASLHDDLSRYAEAEKEYTEALKIYSKLVGINPYTFNEYLAITLNNLAILHKNTTRYTEAEEEFKEALEIRRKVAATNPEANEEFVAITLNNLGNLHKIYTCYSEAEEEYKKALETYRKLALSNPDAYIADMAMTLNNLAILHEDLKHYEEAEEEYKEALEIRRKLAGTNPDAYLGNVAKALENIAELLEATNRKAEAKDYAEEALGIYNQLAEKYPHIWNQYIRETQQLLDKIDNA